MYIVTFQELSTGSKIDKAKVAKSKLPGFQKPITQPLPSPLLRSWRAVLVRPAFRKSSCCACRLVVCSLQCLNASEALYLLPKAFALGQSTFIQITQATTALLKPAVTHDMCDIHGVRCSRLPRLAHRRQVSAKGAQFGTVAQPPDPGSHHYCRSPTQPRARKCRFPERGFSWIWSHSRTPVIPAQGQCKP